MSEYTIISLSLRFVDVYEHEVNDDVMTGRYLNGNFCNLSNNNISTLMF